MPEKSNKQGAPALNAVNICANVPLNLITNVSHAPVNETLAEMK